MFGTRESRHVNSHYQVTEADVQSGARHTDVVALGAWPIEYHASEDAPVVWKTIKNDSTFDIPLRALTSQNTPNLFAAGRLVGGSALRVMGTSFATGKPPGWPPPSRPRAWPRRPPPCNANCCGKAPS